MVKISIVQMKSSINKAENLAYSLDLIEESGKKNAEMICFPEFQMAFSPSSQTSKELFSLSESIEGNFIKELCNGAKKNNISILGTIYEKANSEPKLSESLNNKNVVDTKFHVYDTAVYINNKGLVKSTYRKIHLYDALNFQESKKLLSGNELFTPVDSPLGKVGILICYDLRFPELSRLMTLEGSLALISPSGWVQGTMKEDHWLTMCKARSIENGVYLIAPNQVGNIFCGRSLVIDPFGIVILDMRNREDMDIVDLDIERITTVRNDLPLLDHRRTDLYDLR